ncbi:hypothetical protein G6011_02780 [Alternaria panax]|uniref:Uncharacterized protein n=1 Tax=Alternaria panax TaxID=48097 RepID=A0AAD4I805_9PLEO|nr:hypothetical protein G6011_02780 [Alternaria panax]
MTIGLPHPNEEKKKKKKKKKKSYTQLASHISRLQTVWENATYNYSMENFACEYKGQTLESALIGPAVGITWTDLLELQEDEDVPSIRKPHAALEQKLRRIMPIGIRVGYAATAHNCQDGLDTYKTPAFVYWSKENKPLYQSYTSELVRQQDIIWALNATEAKAEKMAEARWKEFRGLLTLYEAGTLKRIELEWIMLNHATRDHAIALQNMTDIQVDKLIVQFLRKRVLDPTAGAKGELRIKPYKASRKERTDTNLDRHVQRLSTLEGMSFVCASNIRQYAAKIGDTFNLDLLGLPFEENGSILEYDVAETPLHHKHYTHCTTQICEALGITSPHQIAIGISIPDLGPTSNIDPTLLGMCLLVETSIKKYSNTNKKSQKAIVIQALQSIGQLIGMVRDASDQDRNTYAASCTPKLNELMRLFRKFESEGRLDIATANPS